MLYEGGIREPDIIRWPAKIKPGRTCDIPVTGLDLLRTCHHRGRRLDQGS